MRWRYDGVNDQSGLLAVNIRTEDDCRSACSQARGESRYGVRLSGVRHGDEACRRCCAGSGGGNDRPPRRPAATRPKPRPSGPPPRAVSKLHAGRRLGFPRRAAGLTGGLILVLVAVVVLATGGRGASVMRGVAAISHVNLASLGLTVREVHLQGVSRAAQDEVQAAAGIKAGAPIVGVDLAAIRARVERVGWVDHARVIRLFPDTLVIAVTERPLMAVWQHAGRAVVVDQQWRGCRTGRRKPFRQAAFDRG